MGRTVEIPVVHMEFGSFIMVAKELTLVGSRSAFTLESRDLISGQPPNVGRFQGYYNTLSSEAIR